MNPIDRLISQFEKFPGIGPRQARRFVQYLLAGSQASRRDLAEQIKALGSQTSQCTSCFRWFVKRGGNDKQCDICSNPNRDRSILFVIEKDADMDNVERGGFKGFYFVLGGTIPLAEEHPAKFVRLDQLLKRIESDGSGGVLKEIILGFSATTEGDHTRLIIQEKILLLAEKHQFKISSLGRGLSTGSELEYADPDTISQALGNRH